MSSSILDMSILDDSSEDEDEAILKAYVGRSVACPKKQNTAQVSPTTLPPELTQSSSETESEKASEEPTLTKEEIETKAQETIRDLKFHVVQRVQSLDNLGWRRTNKAKEFYFTEAKGTHTYFYPCVRIPQEEAYLMFQQKSSKKQKKIGIQYLGWTWKMAASCDEVMGTTFVPFSSLNEDENEAHLDSFLEAVFGEVDGSFALERRTEELVIRKCWEKVRQQQEEAEAVEEARGMSTAELMKGSKRIQSKTTALHNERNETNKSKLDQSTADDTDDDDYYYSHPVEEVSKKRITLRPGDEIEYYDPIGVAGKEEWLRTTTIIGVHPQNKFFPLNLADGAFLSPDHAIKRLSTLTRGKRVLEQDGVYREIRHFSLRTSGTDELVAFKARVEVAKASRQAHADSMDKFWQDQQPESEGVEGSNEENNSTKELPSRRTSLSRPLGAKNNAEPASSATTTKPTNRRKRQKQELAASLVSDLQFHNDSNGPRLSEHLEKTALVETAGDERHRRSSLSTATGATSRPSICDYSASARKRRRSEVPAAARSTATKRGLHPTPAYEPPSVKKQRRRSSKKVDSTEATSAGSRRGSQSKAARKDDKKTMVPPKNPIDEGMEQLRRCIVETQAKMGKVRRFQPHMTVAQLELGLQVWSRIRAAGVPAEKTIPRVAVDLQIPHRHLTRYLLGDRERPYVLSATNLQTLTDKLQDWVDQQQQQREEPTHGTAAATTTLQ